MLKLDVHVEYLSYRNQPPKLKALKEVSLTAWCLAMLQYSVIATLLGEDT